MVALRFVRRSAADDPNESFSVTSAGLGRHTEQSCAGVGNELQAGHCGSQGRGRIEACRESNKKAAACRCLNETRTDMVVEGESKQSKASAGEKHVLGDAIRGKTEACDWPSPKPSWYINSLMLVLFPRPRRLPHHYHVLRCTGRLQPHPLVGKGKGSRKARQ